MKTCCFYFYAALSLLLESPIWGQATFGLQNRSFPYIDGTVYDAQGVPLEGTNYLVELWGGATPDSLSPAVTFWNPRRRIIVPFRTGGKFFSEESDLCILAVPPFGWAWLQVRAWDARLGPTYEVAAERGVGGYGESPLFYAQGHAGEDWLGIPASLFGLQPFSLRPFSGVFIYSARKQEDQIVLEWIGGAPLYQVQQTSALDHAWENIGPPTSALSFTNNLSADAAFFRVVALPP